MARQSCRRFCSSHNHSPPTSNHVSRQQGQLIVPLLSNSFGQKKKESFRTSLNSNYKSNEKKKEVYIWQETVLPWNKNISQAFTGAPESLHQWRTRGRGRKNKSRADSVPSFGRKRRDSERVSTEEGATEERVVCVWAGMKEEEE